MAGHIADSGNINWCSPLWITQGASTVMGGIDLDPCGNPGSKDRIGARHTFMLPDQNGIITDWEVVNGDHIKSVYVNSPFGRYYQNRVTGQITLPKDFKKEYLSRKEEDAEAANVWRAWFEANNDTYSIGDWVRRCGDAGAKGLSVMQLGPANVGTTTWQDVIEETANAIFYPRGRLYFENVDFETGAVLQTGPAPMDCAVAYWGPNAEGFKTVFEGIDPGTGKKLGSVHILR
jgi:hypothetical protein